MKVLVTGGAGFIASHVAEAYVKAGHEVVVVDDLSSGKRHQVPASATFYRMDVQDPALRDVFARERPAILNHHAAQMDVRRSVADPAFDARVNLLGLINLLEAGRAAGLRRVLFASSGGAAYGEQEEFPASETHKLEPVSPYGVSKASSELYLSCYRAMYGIEFVAMRYANVYGPRQDPHGEAGVVAIFTQKLLAGEAPIINGDGKQTRDYVYVGDLVRANVALLDHPFTGPLNFGTGIETDVNEIFQLVREAVGADVPERHGPAKPGEQRRSVISPRRAQEVLGWKPEVPLGEGLRRTVDFFRSAGS
ncbi:MAG TPA: NAD-dependent epimerase/dehydratase family protein [Candidatus Binatia bacterium]|nr:NAD-dependent epimerase/dehydratase family protein [Candidatus Binatia bacterium]